MSKKSYKEWVEKLRDDAKRIPSYHYKIGFIVALIGTLVFIAICTVASFLILKISVELWYISSLFWVLDLIALLSLISLKGTWRAYKNSLEYEKQLSEEKNKKREDNLNENEE